MNESWILDVNIEANNIVVWLKDNNKVIKKIYPYNPSFYISTKEVSFHEVMKSLEDYPHIVSADLVRKYINIRDHNKSSVLRITVDKLQNYNRIKHKLEHFKDFKLYNTDIPHVRMWLYKNDLFPTAKVAYNGCNNLKLVDYESRGIVDYEIPNFKSIQLDIDVESTHIRPRIDDVLKAVVITTDDEKIVLDNMREVELLLEMCNVINDLDPDIIYTEDGDSFLFPYLIGRGSHYDILNQMTLSRDGYPFEKSLIHLKGAGSYQSYGIMYYRSPLQYFLHGRLHIDGAMGTRAFPWQGLNGIIEVARVTMVPIQSVARITIGQAMTSMQFYEAIKNDILIPSRKINTSEKFKSGLTLLKSDKGGFIFTPKMGFFEDVYELDFTSMYPTIMLTRNISPETILCSCKNTRYKVPELGYNICDKRLGLIPRVLKLILNKRLKYKNLAKRYGKDSHYYARQAALKWILVTSFGYMGYRNARFGRIEAHESVTAFAREILLKTLHIAENYGFRVIHGIVDCLWLQKGRNNNLDDIKSFCQDVKDKTKINLENKGKYNWLIFLPLKSESSIATLNHYYGKFEDGTMKIRGLQIRKHDTPKIVKDAQKDVLNIFKKANNWKEFSDVIPRARKVINHYIWKIKSNSIDPDDLLIKTRISRNISDYVMNSRQVIASKHLEKHGIIINPGQMVQYIITKADSSDPMARVLPAQLINKIDKIIYDKKEYIKLLTAMFSDMLSFREYGTIPC
ncbi:MAG: DNA polymerase domain-containing protein [Candidatus Helarchaeota archaeon]